MKLPPLKIKDLEIQLPIIQGGMGAGVSGYCLAGTVSKEGGLGVISSVALDKIIFLRKNQKLSAREATAVEVQDAKELSQGKPVGINIMVALQSQYEDAVLGALDGGVDVIISGAGLPLRLPEIVDSHPNKDKVKLIPIVSSARVFDLICKRWKRTNRLPDAVVVEGPLAGGHIAWRTIEEAELPSNSLENLVKEVLETAKIYNIPVIAAGGIFTHEDIVKYMEMGCAGVQIGTRFLTTYESGASEEFKQAVINCKKEDVILADKPGSPCGLLFRVIKNCPFYEEALANARPIKCDRGYLLINGKCLAKENSEEAFCICNGLLSAINANDNPNEKGLYSVGSNAYRIDKISSVAEIMKELSGE